MKRLVAFVAGLVAVAIAGFFGTARAVSSTRPMTDRPVPQRRPETAEASGRSAERSTDLHRASARKRWWKRLAKHFALFVAVLAVGGFLVAASGIVPIKASDGHWAITKWLLEFGKQRSFSLRGRFVEVPPLDSLENPSLVLKGAGHYDFGCRPCHGSPSLRHPRVARGLTPTPPYLPTALDKWGPSELFLIVKHGIKFAGMPAWPALERDDEVWAMVAFLRAFPTLDAEAYQRLVHGEVADAEAASFSALLGADSPVVLQLVTESCGRCHGVDGLGRGAGAFPVLAGQRPNYLYVALLAYARGERHSGVMEPIAAGLSADEMRALARYYSRLETPAREPLSPGPLVARGAVIAREGIPTERVPSCADCHGPGGGPRNPFYPSLAGQYADYLVLQLQLFTDERRGGSPYAHLMHPTAHRLTPEQMRDVARYYASLTPDP